MSFTAPHRDLPEPPSSKTWPDLLDELLRGGHLNRATAHWAMRQIVRGEATTTQIAGFLVALRAKGETSAEISGFVDALHESATPVIIPGPTVDIAGTGGDGTGAINVSTMAAIVAAAAGITVVKHGGRSASSLTSGAADLAEHLGIPLDNKASAAAATAAKVGVTFLYAPHFNAGLRHAIDARRGLGIPTVFNTLGPLINPANPHHRVIGAADRRVAPLIAEVLADRGHTGLVVRGRDGLDKLTTTESSDVWVVREGRVSTVELDPAVLSLPRAESGDIRGGTAAENAAAFHALLAGQMGPIRDVVLLNAAAVAATMTLTEDPLEEQIGEALPRCAEAIDSGAAGKVLRCLVARGDDW